MSTATSQNTSLNTGSVTTPATYWLAITNDGTNGQTSFTVPNAGTLWVLYEPQTPAAQIYVWHQGGTTTPINPGSNSITVGQGDMIVYVLNNPATDSIKLEYQMQ